MTAYTCSSPRCGFKAFSLARVELGTCLGRCGERYMRRGDGFFVLQCASVDKYKAVVKSQICAHGRVLGRVPAWAFAPALVELGEWLGRDHERLACNAECIRSVRRVASAYRWGVLQATTTANTRSLSTYGVWAIPPAHVELGQWLG